VNWVDRISAAGRSVQQGVANAYNRLPVDKDAQIAAAICGKLRNAGGFVAALQRVASGDILGGVYRALTPTISYFGEHVNQRIGTINKDRAENGENSVYAGDQGRVTEWCLNHPLVPGNGLKAVAGAAMCLTGYHNRDLSLGLAGLSYIGINGMRMCGTKKMLLTSTILSSTAASTILYSGITHGNIGDMSAGFFSIMNALFLSRIEPKNLTASRG
jgi:hypothetical protein